MPKRKRKASAKPALSDAKKKQKVEAQDEEVARPRSAEGTSQSAKERRYWLMKSEPESRIVKGVDVKFGIDDLRSEPDETACWDGVRNYQARNIMRDEMKLGDLAFFYHSNCKEPGIAGIVEIVREGYVDHTQFDPKDPHFDKSKKDDEPKWYMVDVKFRRYTKRFISLAELKALKAKDPRGPLADMALLARSMLSVQPVTSHEFEFLTALEEQDV